MLEQKGPVTVKHDEHGSFSVAIDPATFPRRTQLTTDSSGLPVYSWIDARSNLPRVTLIVENRHDPENPHFVHVNANHGKPGLKQTRWLIPIFLLTFSALLFLVCYGLYAIREVNTMGMVLIFSMLFYIFLPILARYIGIMIGTAAAWKNPEVSIASWRDLNEFQVTNLMQVYFNIKKIDFYGFSRQWSKKYDDMPVILAHFGLGQYPIDVLRGNWTHGATVDFHRVLTNEFIMKRQAHLLRLAKKSAFVPVKDEQVSAVPLLWRKPADKVASGGTHH